MYDIQILVIVLGLIGTIMIFKFSPTMNSGTYLFTESEIENLKRKDKIKNTLATVGLYLVSISFLLQLGLTIFQKNSGH